MKYVLPLMFLIGVCACGDDDGMTVCNTDNITYNNTVAAIFNNNCTDAGCHASGSVNGSGSLASYEDAVQFVAKGRIVGAINHQAGFTPMPFNEDMLDDCTIDQIEAWIADGTPE